MQAQISLNDRGPDDHWLTRAVFGLDAWLRRRNRVYEYSQDPHCIFRIQVAALDEHVVLADGTTIWPGDRILDLHIWNEQFPRFAGDGATLSWGRRISRDIESSLQLLADYLARTPQLRDIKAVRADAKLGGRQMTPQLIRICSRYGFEPGPQTGSAAPGWFIQQLGKDILIWLLTLARNARALRRDSFRRESVQIFLSRSILDRRYGGRATPEAENQRIAPSGSAVADPEFAFISGCSAIRHSGHVL